MEWNVKRFLNRLAYLKDKGREEVRLQREMERARGM